MTPPPTCCTAEEAAEARAVAAAMAQAAVEKLIGPEICHNLVAAALAKAVDNYNKAEAAKAAPPKRGASASALAERAKAALLEGSQALLRRVKSIQKQPNSPKIPKATKATKIPKTPKSPEKTPKAIEQPDSLPKIPTSPEAPKRTASAGAQLATKAKALFKSTKPLAKRSADAEAVADGPAAVVVEVAIAAPRSGSSVKKAPTSAGPKSPVGERVSAALRRVFACGTCTRQLPLL
ncbi:hypothetical protein Rsub_08378 [Raphidocelis subcapitata]|uniref:Uncharacterized protein n=1 Tax=Raphidocelis subcapitata TaxID=307507 RepID=A0A2V0P6E3_9CHLO|nr:hypothetical protein Rsub_08378 [Raphidocelis subcapitata]|eukprot:GBF95416.1 hypothetical protein Rsub_08378 [Raphidocelis subcapitata]